MKKRSVHKKQKRKRKTFKKQKKLIKKQVTLKKRKLNKIQRGGNMEPILLGLLDEKYVTLPSTRCIKDKKLISMYLSSVTAVELFNLIGKNEKYVDSNTLSLIISKIDTLNPEILKELGSLSKSPAAMDMLREFRVNCFNLTSELDSRESTRYMKELHSYILECENYLSLKDVNWYEMILGLEALDEEFDRDIVEEMREKNIRIDTDKFKDGLIKLKDDDTVREICKQRILECGKDSQSFTDMLFGSISWNSYDECFKCPDKDCIVYLDDNYKTFLKTKHDILTVDKIKILIFMELRLRKISKYFSVASLRIKDKRYSKVNKLLKQIYNDDVSKNNTTNNSQRQLLMKQQQPFYGESAINNPIYVNKQFGGDDGKDDILSSDIDSPEGVDLPPDLASPEGVDLPEGIDLEKVNSPPDLASPEGVNSPEDINDDLDLPPDLLNTYITTNDNEDTVGNRDTDESKKEDSINKLNNDLDMDPNNVLKPFTDSVEEPGAIADSINQKSEIDTSNDLPVDLTQNENTDIDEETKDNEGYINPLEEKKVKFSKMIYTSYNGVVNNEKEKEMIGKHVAENMRKVCKLNNKERLKVYRVRSGPRSVSVEVGIEDPSNEDELSDKQIKDNIVNSIVSSKFIDDMIIVDLNEIKDIYFDGISEYEELKEYPSQYKRVLLEMEGIYPKTDEDRINFESKLLNDIKELFGDPDLDINRIHLENITNLVDKEDRVFVQFVILNGLYEKRTPNELIKEFKDKYSKNEGDNEFTKQYKISNVTFGEPSIILDKEDSENSKSLSEEKKDFEQVDKLSYDNLQTNYKRFAYFGCERSVNDIKNNVIKSTTSLSPECENDINKIIRGF